jgi:hypothetical protein
VLETADPLIKTSKTAYEGLHDTLVVSWCVRGRAYCGVSCAATAAEGLRGCLPCLRSPSMPLHALPAARTAVLGGRGSRTRRSTIASASSGV